MDISSKDLSRLALGKARTVKSYIWTAGCILLVGVNIAVFLLIPHLLSAVAIILSNVITLIIALLAYKPVNSLLQDALLERQKELIEKLEKDKELELKVERLERENRDLSDKLDTRAQTAVIPSSIDYTFKLEQLEYTKKGYIVKEEELASLDDSLYPIPEKKFEAFLSELLSKDPGQKKILYIHKHYYKASIGIDFGEIMYAYSDDAILFYGVEFRKLHDISSELDKDPSDIDRCEVLRIVGDRTEISQDKDYEELKELYRQEQAAEVKSSMEEDMNAMCKQYTVALQDSIRERFGERVDFVDTIEGHRDVNWYALKVSTDPTVREVAGAMLMLTSVMNRTRLIGDDTVFEAVDNQ